MVQGSAPSTMYRKNGVLGPLVGGCAVFYCSFESGEEENGPPSKVESDFIFVVSPFLGLTHTLTLNS